MGEKREGEIKMAIENVDEERFRELLKGERPVLADFWAPWCVHCRRLEPAFDATAGQYKDLLIKVKINIDEEPHLASTEQIDVIPTLKLYKGDRAVGSITAPGSKSEIDRFIKETLAGQRAAYG